MTNLLLYTTTVLIWGSTWLAITFQIGIVDPLLSISYRFGLASLLLLTYCLVTGKNLRFPLRAHIYILFQGATLFGLNYWLFYLTTQHLTSGLVSVVFASLLVMNVINGRLFRAGAILPHVVLAAAIGLLGIVLVFWPEFEGVNLKGTTSLALLMAVAATYSASLGNLLSARNQANGLPVLQTNAIGMGYGALLMLIMALVGSKPINFVWSLPYLSSLLYLSIFGSIVAFGCYLTLIGRLGADKAAYATLLFPIIALQLSVWFEDYRWTLQSLVGLSLVLLGNLIILTPPKRLHWIMARVTGRSAPKA
ncbi:MAG: DMT family transporter [Anaerolineales bacterium]|nr:DMT family transporter [Anaerolineales bacterium]